MRLREVADTAEASEVAHFRKLLMMLTRVAPGGQIRRINPIYQDWYSSDTVDEKQLKVENDRRGSRAIIRLTVHAPKLVDDPKLSQSLKPVDMEKLKKFRDTVVDFLEANGYQALSAGTSSSNFHYTVNYEVKI